MIKLTAFSMFVDLKTGCKTTTRKHEEGGTLEYQHWIIPLLD